MYNKDKMQLNNVLFWISYILIIACSMFSRIIFLKPYMHILDIISIPILLLCFFLSLNGLPKKRVLIYLLIILISFISYYICRDATIFKLVLLLFSSKNIEFNKFIATDLKIKLFFIAIVLCCHYLGLTNDYIMLRSDGLIRNSVGFSHPNVFGMYILMTCMEFVYFKKGKIKLHHFILLSLIIFFIDYFSNSRTSIVVLIIFMLYLLSKKIVDKILDNRNIQFLIKRLFLILTVLVISITYLYSINNHFGIVVNNVTSNRIYSIYYFLKTYGIHLFGSKLYLVSSEMAQLNGIKSFILDNSFMNVMIQYGLCVYVILYFLFKKTFHKLFQDNNKILIVIFIILMIYGIMETGTIKIIYNPFLLYFSNILFMKDSDKVEKY